MAEGLHKDPPRITQGRHKQMDANRLAVDLNPDLAKVNLQLMAWRCLEANRRPRLRLKLTPPRDYRPFETVRRLTSIARSRARS